MSDRPRLPIILHITDRASWERARAAGSYRGDTLDAAGFIHCATPAQLGGVARRFFAGRRGLVLLRIDPGRLDAPLRYEPSPDAPEPFPHIHGPLNLEAVVAVEDFEPGEDGSS